MRVLMQIRCTTHNTDLEPEVQGFNALARLSNGDWTIDLSEFHCPRSANDYCRPTWKFQLTIGE